MAKKKNNKFVFYDCSDCSYYRFPTLFLDYDGKTLVKAIKIGKFWNVETDINSPFGFLFANENVNHISINSCKKYIIEKMELFTKDYFFAEIKTIKQQ